MQTLTEEQAWARLDEYLQAALAQVEPRPQLEENFVSAMPCDDPSDGGPPGRVFVEANFMLRRVPPERNRQIFDDLHRYWADLGFVVLHDLRERPEVPWLTMRYPDDGYTVGLMENLANELKLTVSSPCVWPEGDPPPAD